MGPEQTERYLATLRQGCSRLSDTPAFGRRCDAIRPGLWRAETGRHVVFFRRDVPGGVFVVRILHCRHLAVAQPFEDDE